MKKKIVVKIGAGMVSVTLMLSVAGCTNKEMQESQAAESVVESIVESVAEESSDEAAESVAEESGDEAAESVAEESGDEAAESVAEESSDQAAESVVEESSVATAEESTDGSEKDAEETNVVAERTKEADEEKSIVATYSKLLIEELDGENVVVEYTYTFYEDHTGVADLQDRVEFTWDDERINENGQVYTYTIQDDALMIGRHGFLDVYQKQN